MHSKTPLLPSPVLSEQVGRQVLLKLESIQPSASYKIRGHGFFCTDAVTHGATKLVCSSGGNAGAAVAYAAHRLGVEALIVVPTTTPQFMVDRLRALNATVEIVGHVWDTADAYAREQADTDGDSTVFVHPFDSHLLWMGISSLVFELRNDCLDVTPAAISLSVGGGGLFSGVALGCSQVGWDDVPIIAAETQGADSFAAMIKEERVTPIPAITSIAKSLGALQVSQKCAEWVFEQKRAVRSCVVSDREAVEACSLLATHHRVLVEPACGAAIAAILKEEALAELGSGPIIVVVCGGNMCSPALLDKWIKETGATAATL